MQPSEQDHWQSKLRRYTTEEWAEKPSLFAEFAVTYFPASGNLLELGTGSGQDSIWFASKGYKVTQTDVIDDVFEDIKKRAAKNKVQLEQKVLDLWQPLEFAENSFDVVYAQLSLHYFDAKRTSELFKEINHVLKPGGTFALMLNSKDDPEYGAGEEIEPGYFQVEKLRKRYFNVEDARKYLNDFEIVVLNNEGQTYKDLAKGVRNQIQAICRSKK